MDIHVYLHSVDELAIRKKLDAILAVLTIIKQQEDIMSAELDALTAQVAQNTSVEQSAIQLIQGIAAQLVAAKADPSAIQALADQLHTSATALAAAVSANTVPTV